MLKILAIETSCDETACAVIGAKENNKQKAKTGNPPGEIVIEILSNVVASQIDLHKKFGGVYPELASRAHAESILPVIEEALHKAKRKMQSEKVWSTADEGPDGFQLEGRNDVGGDFNLAEAMGEVDAQRRIGARSFDKLRMTSLMEEIDAIAVTYGPGLVGSLVVGLAAAKTLAYTFGKPIIPINHWEGHIYSNFVRVKSKNQISNDKEEESLRGENISGSRIKSVMAEEDKCQKLPGFPALVLTVSGGHTNIVLMKDHGEYELVGQTMDDAAGEAFDKIARLLGLGYPGGPAISAMAEIERKRQSEKRKNIEFRQLKETDQEMMSEVASDSKYKLPRPMLHSGDLNFSFSGLKTAVLYKVREIGELNDEMKAEFAFEVQEAITDTLIGKMEQAIEKYRPKSICLAGGVSANKILREKFLKLKEKIDYHPQVFIPPFELTTDNAAMIGIAGMYHFVSGDTKKWYDINVASNAILKGKD